MKRWLEINVGGAGIDGVTRKELFRMAAESRLITNIEKWYEYNKSRNEIAHTYDQAKAEDVYVTASVFVIDAKALLKVLEAKND
jgi:uncharacterized protein with HEPN domain